MFSTSSSMSTLTASAHHRLYGYVGPVEGLNSSESSMGFRRVAMGTKRYLCALVRSAPGSENSSIVGIDVVAGPASM
jgi:hypothetical protein